MAHSQATHPGLPRRIAHLDMDAFFASVELLEHPELKGLPVVVGGRRPPAAVAGQPYPRLKDYVGRGVATTATYEARAFGVHSGMGLMKAAALAPEAILLPAHFEAYARVSVMFCTDRKLDPRTGGFGGGRGAGISYGEVIVSVPHGHKTGEMEAPSFWKLEFREDPRKHMTILDWTPHTRMGFLNRVKAKVQAQG